MRRSDEHCDASIVATKQVVWTPLSWGLLIFAVLPPIGLSGARREKGVPGAHDGVHERSYGRNG